jgi:hypothetical protein
MNYEAEYIRWQEWHRELCHALGIVGYPTRDVSLQRAKVLTFIQEHRPELWAMMRQRDTEVILKTKTEGGLQRLTVQIQAGGFVTRATKELHGEQNLDEVLASTLASIAIAIKEDEDANNLEVPDPEQD